MTTAAEMKHLAIVGELGCLICGDPAQVHHIREGQGIAQRASHFLTVPLCQAHHTGIMSIHGCRRTFEKIYGSELVLLARTIERIETALIEIYQ